MARKARKRSYGAVAKRGGSYRGSQKIRKMLRVCVSVSRDVGSSSKFQYRSTAKACTGGAGRGRYGEGYGRTPTAAVKKALKAYASHVR